jgi:uncharacterized OB-fold protein
MSDWLESVEALVYESRIKVPYTWSVGETGSRFLTELRDHGKILGTKCAECGVVYLPPRKHCGRCFSKTLHWVELGLEGTLVTHTVVRYSSSVMPMKPPFAYGIILLDGASTGLVSILGQFNNREGTERVALHCSKALFVPSVVRCQWSVVNDGQGPVTKSYYQENLEWYTKFSLSVVEVWKR